jgi:hyperosmotically inducible protein
MMNLKFFTVTVFSLTAALAMAATEPAKNTDVNNTAMNKRDADSRTLTPTDQSKGSTADVELTRKIRQLVVKDDAMSSDAKNVKIITINGIATLRGPVDSMAESSKIASLATQVVGKRAVRNQLEVKAPDNK